MMTIRSVKNVVLKILLRQRDKKFDGYVIVMRKILMTKAIAFYVSRPEASVSLLSIAMARETMDSSRHIES